VVALFIPLLGVDLSVRQGCEGVVVLVKEKDYKFN
jgi:hypothetical protein